MSFWRYRETRGGPFRYGITLCDELRTGRSIGVSFHWRADTWTFVISWGFWAWHLPYDLAAHAKELFPVTRPLRNLERKP